MVARRVADFSARQRILGEHRLHEQRAARGLRPHHAIVRGDAEAPRVAALRTVLLEGGAVGLEAHDAGANAPEVLRAIAIRHVAAAAVAVRGVDPPVPAPAWVVDDRMRVARAEAGVELLDFARAPVRAGLVDEENVRRLRDDDAVLVKDEAGDEFEPLVKHLLRVHHTVAFARSEDADFVLRLALLRAGRRINAPVIFPLVPTVIGPHPAPAIRILRRLRDPQPPRGIPVEIHRLRDQRFRRDDLHREVGMHFEIRKRLLRLLRPAIGIRERGNFLRLAKLIHIRALPRPSDSAQQKRAEIRPLKRAPQMAGDRDERAIRRGCARGGGAPAAESARGALAARCGTSLRRGRRSHSLIHPHLRLDVVDVRLPARRGLFPLAHIWRVARREHAHVRRDVHVVVNLVVEMEVRRALRDRMPAVEPLVFREVEIHRPLLPLRLPRDPRAADD